MLAGSAGNQDRHDPLVGQLFRLVLHLFRLFRLDHADGGFDQVPDHRFHVPAHVADFGKFGGFHLDEGGVRPVCASLRAISVFPTPVGPIIKMFFGTISSRSFSGSRLRRYRLRRATATDRLACFCPTMYLSSSATICRGVKLIPVH